MIIPDNLLKATLAETFSNFLNYSTDEESRDFPEATESWAKVDSIIESDDLKSVDTEAKRKLDNFVNETMYQYQKQGFIQGFMQAVKMAEEGKIFVHSEPLKEAQQNFNREING